jgi:hypothetical protein
MTTKQNKLNALNMFRPSIHLIGNVTSDALAIPEMVTPELTQPQPALGRPAYGRCDEIARGK